MDGYLYTKNGEKYFYQLDERGVFYFDAYNVRKFLEDKFGLNRQEQKDLIKGILERHYNLEGYTVFTF
jgi:hypothetical protein